MGKDMPFLQSLLLCLQNISLTQVESTSEEIINFIDKSTGGIFGNLIRRDNSFWSQLSRFPARQDTIYECISLGGITYFACKSAESQAYYFLGPVLTKPFSGNDLQREAARFHIPEDVYPHLLDFFSNLPVVSAHTAYRMADLIFGHLTNTDISLKFGQINTLSAIQDYYGTHLALPEKEIVEMRQMEHRYELSKSITEAVKQGNLSLALHLMGNYTPATSNPIRNPNPLRNAQNYCIVLNTQLRHALEGSGIHPSRIDALSNEIGMQIERLHSLSQIQEFTSRVIKKYCHLVQEYSFPDLRPLTHLAVSYIKDHLAENLTVKETASALSVNANYLSSIFHADLGITFIDFVNRERIKQAAALLKNTGLQIQQISVLVGYNNTSYFAKHFKRVFDKTPHDYRHGIV